MARRRAKILTERELEVMNAVWRLGKGTVKEIRSEMGGDLAGAYTSIATMLKFLESKGMIRHEQDGRTYYYFPNCSKKLEQHKALNFLVQNYFDGDIKFLLRTLRENSQTDLDLHNTAVKTLISSSL